MVLVYAILYNLECFQVTVINKYGCILLNVIHFKNFKRRKNVYDIRSTRHVVFPPPNLYMLGGTAREYYLLYVVIFVSPCTLLS